jgi:hypothetical protein
LSFGECPSPSPTPTRTPSITPSRSITPSISVSSTPASTPSRTPSITPSTSTLACECQFYDVTIDQNDLDNATGNTDPGKDDGVVYVDYINCAGSPATAQYSFATYFPNSICAQSVSSIYYYSFNFQTAVSFSSVTGPGSDCCV